MEIRHFTRPVIITLLIGPLAWIAFAGLYYSFTWGTLTSTHIGTFVQGMRSPFFWLTSFFTVAVAILPSYLINYFYVRTNPTPNDIAGEIEKFKMPLPKQPPPRKFDDPAGYSRYAADVHVYLESTCDFNPMSVNSFCCAGASSLISLC